ncbi:MAG: hypothetical protein FWE13_01670 [Firmicutes bacterium]|nr:hypothetical protein [Bacillota bacterium]
MINYFINSIQSLNILDQINALDTWLRILVWVGVALVGVILIQLIVLFFILIFRNNDSKQQSGSNRSKLVDDNMADDEWETSSTRNTSPIESDALSNLHTRLENMNTLLDDFVNANQQDYPTTAERNLADRCTLELAAELGFNPYVAPTILLTEEIERGFLYSHTGDYLTDEELLVKQARLKLEVSELELSELHYRAGMIDYVSEKFEKEIVICDQSAIEIYSKMKNLKQEADMLIEDLSIAKKGQKTFIQDDIDKKLFRYSVLEEKLNVANAKKEASIELLPQAAAAKDYNNSQIGVQETNIAENKRRYNEFVRKMEASKLYNDARINNKPFDYNSCLLIVAQKDICILESEIKELEKICLRLRNEREISYNKLESLKEMAQKATTEEEYYPILAEFNVKSESADVLNIELNKKQKLKEEKEVELLDAIRTRDNLIEVEAISSSEIARCNEVVRLNIKTAEQRVALIKELELARAALRLADDNHHAACKENDHAKIKDAALTYTVSYNRYEKLEEELNRFTIQHYPNEAFIAVIEEPQETKSEEDNLENKQRVAQKIKKRKEEVAYLRATIPYIDNVKSANELCERFNQLKLSLDEEESASAELREIIERSISDAQRAGKDAMYEERIRNAEHKTNNFNKERVVNAGTIKRPPHLHPQRRPAMSQKHLPPRPVRYGYPMPHSYPYGGYVPPVISRRVPSSYPPQYYPYVRPMVRRVYPSSYPPPMYAIPTREYPVRPTSNTVPPRASANSSASQRGSAPPPDYKGQDGYPITVPLHTSPPTIPETNKDYMSSSYSNSQHGYSKTNVRSRVSRNTTNRQNNNYPSDE